MGGVKELFNEMTQFKILPNVVTFSIVVDALCKERKTEDAEHVFQVMIQKGDNPNVITYNSLMDGYCLQGRMEEARRVFDMMMAVGLAPTTCVMPLKLLGQSTNLFRKLKYSNFDKASF